ncbi:hypothetical protein TUSST3_68810 [Streptomyces sp. TUS-ST3]|uniref:MBL fold metallo-hydrolase n=1 Tax=Streptomyces sp. TUS-ST3 TaxID=3025591 RepID=UPI00235B4D62|nr:MBL fold metallo-hydrolase [Streptomyces sp. TUS-ST3]GLP70260.1 hypothetical protein TUSST3_68810 [Streptomyces sp. TUS-ST3]
MTVCTLTFNVLDLDFPVSGKNKTPPLITGEEEALLVDAGFTRADGHRLAAEILDAGKMLTTVFVSHADPDFFFGAEVIADTFPDARFVATPLVIEHIAEPAHLARTTPAEWAGEVQRRCPLEGKSAALDFWLISQLQGRTLWQLKSSIPDAFWTQVGHKDRKRLTRAEKE